MPCAPRLRDTEGQRHDAGLKPREVTRLERAVGGVEVSAMYALYDGSGLTTMMNPHEWPTASLSPQRGSQLRAKGQGR